MSHKDLLLLRKFLFKFRLYIRGYIFVGGITKSIVYIIAAFFLSMLLDRTFHFDYGQRLIVNGSFLIFLLIYSFNKLIKPLFHKISDDYLCRKIEKRYTEFSESVLTGHYFVDASLDKIGDISFELSESVLHQAAENSNKIKLGKLFDLKKLTKLMMGFLIVCSLFFYFVNLFHNEFNIWVKRNILFENVKWPYQTILFVEGASNYKIVVPYKSDLKIKILADTRGVIPDQIIVNQMINNETTLTTQLSRIGQNTFLYNVSEVSEGFTFTIEGNDYTSEEYEVISSSRPEIESFTLMVEYPKYIGYPDEKLDVNQSILEVLEGSSIILKLKAKEEVKDSILIDSTGNECLNKKIDGNEVTFVLEPDQIKRTSWSLNLFDKNNFDLYQKVLFDVIGKKDNVVSTNINVPKIGNVLTPSALFGVVWNSNDDYGIHKVSANIKEIDLKEAVKNEVQELVDESDLKDVTSKDGVYIVDLSKYNLTAGNSLILSFACKDFKKDREEDSFSNSLRFQIINDQEFQKYLFNKEEELGFGVSLMKKTIDSMLSELILHSELNENNKLIANRSTVYLNMQKKLKELSLKNKIVVEKFGIIVNEIKVNKFEVYNEADLKRINEFVVKGLNLINDELFPLQLNLFSTLKSDNNQDKLVEAKKCSEMIQNEYVRILKNIRRTEGYHETVTLLKEVIKSQKDLLDKTKDRNNDKIEGFFDE